MRPPGTHHVWFSWLWQVIEITTCGAPKPEVKRECVLVSQLPTLARGRWACAPHTHTDTWGQPVSRLVFHWLFSDATQPAWAPGALLVLTSFRAVFVNFVAGGLGTQ